MLNFQKVIPENWSGVYAPTEEDLAFLGFFNLEFLKRYWRKQERITVGQIKKVQAQVEMLDGKTIDDVKAMAAEFDHPAFPEIGVRDGSWGRHLEPLDDDLRNREPGATTLNYCGWCRFGCGGICRHGYKITTMCLLIPKDRNNGSGAYGFEEFTFNTPCAIANGTQELLETCVMYLKTRLAELKERKAEIGEMISLIMDLKESAEKKPYLAGHRNAGWFEVGEDVICFVSNNFQGALKKGIFVTGKVIDGYRHGDRCISVRTDEKVHNGSFLEGHGLGFGLCRPEVLHEWEYNYLKTHPEYLKVWLRASAGLSEFDPAEMAEAFR
ncbi:hypothetical protein IKE98_03595 [Candidatus Saccharibacteria bacterium]|nr:hypothetical protein [Candidatus Saccharibacteria bacterium]